MLNANVQGDELIYRGQAYLDHRRREEEERAKAPKIENMIGVLEQCRAGLDVLTGRVQQVENALASGFHDVVESHATLRSEVSKLALTVSGLADLQIKLLSQFTDLTASLKAPPLEALPASADVAPLPMDIPAPVAPANANEPAGSAPEAAEGSGKEKSRRGIWGAAAVMLMLSLIVVSGVVYAWPLRH